MVAVRDEQVFMEMKGTSQLYMEDLGSNNFAHSWDRQDSVGFKYFSATQ